MKANQAYREIRRKVDFGSLTKDDCNQLAGYIRSYSRDIGETETRTLINKIGKNLTSDQKNKVAKAIFFSGLVEWCYD